MTLLAAVGQSTDFDGRKACLQAIEQANNKVSLTGEPVQLAFIFVSQEYDLNEVMQTASVPLGSTPLLGCSSPGQLTQAGSRDRSVVVALLAGGPVSVDLDWWPGFADNSHDAAEAMLASLRPEDGRGQTLLVLADGLFGDGQTLCQVLPPGDYKLGGCMTGGSLQEKQSQQIGGSQSGTGGLAAARLSGDIRSGVGLAHGWESIGMYFQVTRAEGVWIRTLNKRPSSETYADVFGQPTKDWIHPPLNELVRLYPLGIESDEQDELLLRSPLQVEVDGSFRMSTPVPEGSTGHLMIGSVSTCVDAITRAAEQALLQLGSARPVLALIFADISWKMMFDATPGLETRALREVLGSEVPIAGTYSVGQIGQHEIQNAARLYNQHIQIVLIGTPG